VVVMEANPINKIKKVQHFFVNYVYKVMKKLLIFLFCVLLSVAGCHKDNDLVMGGKIGELSWMLYRDGTLTISGAGEIPDFHILPTEILPPWFERRNDISKVVIGNEVSKIGSFAFFRCENLTSVTFGSSIRAIGYRAFSGCTGLKSVTIPDLVTIIEDEVFSGCTGLTSVIIPNSVITIGNASFYQCESLTSVIIPNSVTTIGENAFFGCIGLTSVTIGSSVATIGDDAFRNCTNLNEIINNATTPQSINPTMFWGIDSLNRTLFVPIESLEAYIHSDWALAGFRISAIYEP